MNSKSVLKLVKPITVTPAMVVSTNVVDSTAAYNVGTTYAEGQRVKNAAGTLIYESSVAGNVGNALTDTTKWVEVSPTNPWKAFDTSNSTQSAQAGSMTWTIAPGMAITAFSALNLTGATSMVIQMNDPTYGLVYDETVDLSAIPMAPDWWSWTFGERRGPSLSILTDLPSYPNAQLVITLNGASNLAIGVILFGQMRSIGTGVKMGARIGIQDYSRKETNEFGDIVLVQRAYAKRASFDMMLTSSEVDLVQNELASVRAVPSLWIGSSAYESTVVYGIYKDFSIVISYHDYSDCTIDLEGLT